MPDYSLPSFLAPRADQYEPEYGYDEYEQQSTLEHELRDPSGLVRASIITVAVAISGIVLAVALGHPVKVLADATASLSDNSGLQRGDGPSSPLAQRAADARSSAPAPAAPLTQAELAALAELTSQVRTESNEPASGALLEQFQAWATRQDTQGQERAQAEEPVQPVEAEPVQIARDEPAPEEPLQAHRTIGSLQNAHAEMPHVQKSKAKIQRKLGARRQAAPVQDARAQQLPVPNAQQPSLQPSFMQTLGWNQ